MQDKDNVGLMVVASDGVAKTPEEMFKDLFAYLVGLYPNPGLVQGSQAAYWRYLQDLPLEAIRKAIHRSPAASPQFFPTAALLRQIAQDAQRSLDSGGVYVPPDEPFEPPPDTPAADLVREWKAESERLGLRPNDETPREVGIARFRKIYEILPVGTR